MHNLKGVRAYKFPESNNNHTEKEKIKNSIKNQGYDFGTVFDYCYFNSPLHEFFGQQGRMRIIRYKIFSSRIGMKEYFFSVKLYGSNISCLHALPEISIRNLFSTICKIIITKISGTKQSRRNYNHKNAYICFLHTKNILII